jgi:type III secretory pathway component EscU
MADNVAKHRLTALAWIVVSLISGFLAIETVETIREVGLFGTRPPLPPTQTVLRILIFAVALGLLWVLRSALERVTLLAAAAAAGSTALYGLGYRSAGLSALRLLSHVAAYGLIMAVASVKVSAARRE